MSMNLRPFGFRLNTCADGHSKCSQKDRWVPLVYTNLCSVPLCVCPFLARCPRASVPQNYTRAEIYILVGFPKLHSVPAPIAILYETWAHYGPDYDVIQKPMALSLCWDFGPSQSCAMLHLTVKKDKDKEDTTLTTLAARRHLTT